MTTNKEHAAGVIWEDRAGASALAMAILAAVNHAEQEQDDA